MNRSCLGRLCLFALVTLAPFALAQEGAAEPSPYVTIVDHGRYFDVRIDYAGARRHRLSPRAIGREYGQKILALGLPIEPMYDAVVSQTISVMLDTGVIDEPEQAFAAVRHIKRQVPARYRAELEGLASVIATAPRNELGDGRLSPGELDFLHLIQDTFRTQCSGVSVYGRRAARRETATAFLMDFFGREVLGHLHAVTTISDGRRSLAMVGFLGILNSTVAVNDDGVFVGVPSSEVAAEYDPAGKRSVFFEVRAALEQHSTLRGVAAAMMKPRKQYAQGFNLSLADRHGAAILELDNLGHRGLRRAGSALNPGVEPWPFRDAVATVNSFVLEGNTDNHTADPVNFGRWNSYIAEIEATGPVTSLEELKRVVSFDGGDGPDDFLAGSGDIYNQWTVTISVFVPAKLRLEVFFAPAEGPMPDDPDFVRVPLRF